MSDQPSTARNILGDLLGSSQRRMNNRTHHVESLVAAERVKRARTMRAEDEWNTLPSDLCPDRGVEAARYSPASPLGRDSPAPAAAAAAAAAVVASFSSTNATKDTDTPAVDAPGAHADVTSETSAEAGNNASGRKLAQSSIHKCCVCKDRYDNERLPVILSGCGHGVCFECVQRLAQYPDRASVMLSNRITDSRAKLVPCPQCRENGTPRFNWDLITSCRLNVTAKHRQKLEPLPVAQVPTWQKFDQISSELRMNMNDRNGLLARSLQQFLWERYENQLTVENEANPFALHGTFVFEEEELCAHFQKTIPQLMPSEARFFALNALAIRYWADAMAHAGESMRARHGPLYSLIRIGPTTYRASGMM